MKTKSNYILKVALIVLFAALAVGGVLFFMKSRVQPPKSLEYVNQYTENIEQETNHIAHANEQSLEQDFQRVINRIDLLRSENLINNDEYKTSLSDFINGYVPSFRDWCEQQFNNNVWPKNTLAFMQKRLNEMRRHRSILTEDNKTKLNEVEKVLNDYDKAWKLKKIAITSSAESRTHLHEANQFKQDPHLKNCTELMDMLNRLPETYKNSHYRHVNSLVQKLNIDNYSKYDVNLWGTRYNEAKSARRDYNNAAPSLYGVETSDFNLDEYYWNAKNGFYDMISVYDRQDIRDSYRDVFGTTIR